MQMIPKNQRKKKDQAHLRMGPQKLKRFRTLHGVPCQAMTLKSKKWNFIGQKIGGSRKQRLRRRVRLDPTLDSR